MGLFSRKKDVGDLVAARDFEGLAKAIRKDDQRAAAADAIVELADPAAIPPLLDVIEIRNVGEEAIAAIQEAVRGLGAVAAEPLAAQAREGRHTAGALLGVLGEDTAMPVARELIAQGGDARIAGYRAVARVGTPAAIETLLAAFETDHRGDALTGVASDWHGEDPALIEALFAMGREVVDTPAEQWWQLCFIRLGATLSEPGAGDTALPILADKLSDESAGVRMLAATTLFAAYSAAGPEGPEDAKPDPRTADALAGACQDEELEVRKYAGGALALQGDRRATPALTPLLRSNDEDSIRLVINALKVSLDPAAYDEVDLLYKHRTHANIGMKTTLALTMLRTKLDEARKEASPAGVAG